MFDKEPKPLTREQVVTLLGKHAKELATLARENGCETLYFLFQTAAEQADKECITPSWTAQCPRLPTRHYPRRWNACPSQELLVIRQNPKTGERSLDLLKWGLSPYWCKDPKGGRKPINAKSETVARLPMFRDDYRLRRCILPVDGFYEWMAT
jgi:putative SOS response-associated peptidase YedK